MKKRVFKITAIGFGSIILILYAAFLIVPFFLNGIIEKYNSDIVNLIKNSTGLNAELNELKIVTTPKLTAGIKLAHAEFTLPEDKKFLSADNFEIKLSLLPLLLKKVELDKISVENTKFRLDVKSDGHFLIEDYIPQSVPSDNETSQTVAGLPFGLKLSNHLPDIGLKKFYVEFVDIPTDKKYYLDGSYLYLTDFILNKKVKVKAAGEIFLDGEEHFGYDLKIKNYIMPDLVLNDLVFPQEIIKNVENEDNYKKAEMSFVNIIDIFDKIHNNGLAGNLKADIKTYGNFDDINYTGKISADGITVKVDGQKLPEGVINAELKEKKAKIVATLHPAEDENISLLSTIETGKNFKYDVHLIANAGINNFFNLIDSVAKSFDINDFDTLSATGNINANFYVSGDTQKVTSSGYFKIPEASINYKLYNILIDKINADADFSDNNVNIKNISFTVFNQPLKLYGTLTSDAVADLYLVADNLLIKALAAAAGQVALLKENDFKSGTLSMEATLKGKLSNPSPALNLSVDNLKIKNIPSNTTLSLANGSLNLTTEDSSYEGVLNLSSANLDNPALLLKAPAAKITMDENDINIDNAYLLIDNSRIDITGGIKDYMSQDLCIDISANGKLNANDLKNMLPAEFRSFVTAKGSLPLSVKISGNPKAQKADIAINATPDNYFKILDIDKSKNKPSTIKSTLVYSNDSLKISDTEMTSEGFLIAKIDGSINNLSKTQNLSINVVVPELIGMPVPLMGDNSLLSLKGNLTAGGTILNPTLKGNVEVPELNIPDMKFSMKNLNANLSGKLANGSATLENITSGGIVAENLTSDFTFNPNNGIFNLKNIKGKAFSGDIGGDVAYNLYNGKIGVDMTGSGLDAIKAIEGATEIKNALSGTLGFTANVTLSGATDIEMIKNLKGKMSFDVADGAFLSIGKIENLLAADNIVANAVMKTALSAISTVPVIKNSANFQYIKGNMTFNNGWAENISIKASGPSMAYYITGKYNILNGTANLVILGRLGSDVVAALGPLGELSVDKLTSYIPKFGTLTANIIKTMTSNPKNENVDAIPELSSGNAQYKDFKVNFNGGIESKSSVKSFKWLSNPDLSGIEGPSLKEQIETSTENIKQTIKTNIETAKQQNELKKQQAQEQAEQLKLQAEQKKENIKNQVQNVKDSIDEIKNLFKSPKQNSAE